MFFRPKRKKLDNARAAVRRVRTLVFRGFGALFFWLRPRKVYLFLRGQKKEISELTSGKENLSQFFGDSGRLLQDLFIPYEGNSHRPKALRPRMLTAYVIIAVIVKIAVTGVLFFTYPSPAQLAAIVTETMLELTNQNRAEVGATPLTLNPELVRAATEKGKDMLARHYFAHDTPDGVKPWNWIDKSHYDYVFAGENLAMDFVTAEAVQEAFMKSPSHRRNILNERYKEIGLAVLNGELEGRQTILLVVFFGTQSKDYASIADASTVETAAVPTPTPTPTPAPTPIAVAEPAVAAVAPTPEPVTPPVNQLPVAEPQTSPVVEGKDQPTVAVQPQPVGTLPIPEPTSDGVIQVTVNGAANQPIVEHLIEYSNIFFLAFLIFMVIALVLNVLVKIQVQHSSVIFQSVVVIALLAAMYLVKFHFAEQVPSEMLIL